ncbi:MAG: GtrA family protein [Anaerolineae bacterium]
MAQFVASIRNRASQNRVELVRFVKFGIVGSIGAVVDFSILNLCIQAFGMEKWLANTFSFTAAVLSNFLWNRLWTYPESRKLPILPQLGRFFLVNLGGYAINQVIFLSLDHFVFSPWGTLGYNVSKAIAIGVVLFWNFGINRIWTYREIK